MKILIGTEDVAGWIQQYKSGFESFGHEVTTAVFKKSSFFDVDYEYVFDEMFRYKIDSRQLLRHQFLKRVKRKIKNEWKSRTYKKLIHSLIDKHDVIIQMWHPFLPSSAELLYARKRNKKIISVFVGSDVRYFKAFKQEFDVSKWNFPKELDNEYIDYHLQLIRNAEKYSDLIYSVPDQAGLQMKPYYHLQVPLNTGKFVYHVPGNKIPKIVHAPSVPFKKGTDIIEATLASLKNEGVAFELMSVRNMPNDELLQLLSQADILVDEIVYNGPGTLSFEAMMSGCAVATRYINNSPQVFCPPVMNINADNIYKQLKTLLTNPQLIKELAIKGREYALRNNSSAKIVADMLKNLEIPGQPDYYPDFLRQRFVPGSKSEILSINKWTSFVKDCDWYSVYVNMGEREGLVF